MIEQHQKLIERVAAQLGFAPKLENSCWQSQFVMPDGGSFDGMDSRQRGKLTFSCWTPYALAQHKPYYRDGNAPKTEISVADTKSAEQIVADVRRRLLPEYERLAADCRKGKASHDEACSQQQAAARQLAEALGVEVKSDSNGAVQNIHISAGEVYATFRMSGNGSSVYIERADVPLACAVEIARAMRAHMFERKEEVAA